MVVTRDWKGQYDSKAAGWTLFCGEKDIETGGDCFAQVFKSGGEPRDKLSGQEVYDLYQRLMSENIKGYDLDVTNDIVTEK